jgi:hypothetical protein
VEPDSDDGSENRFDAQELAKTADANWALSETAGLGPQTVAPEAPHRI